MREIPGMVVINPADDVEARAAVKAAYELSLIHILLFYNTQRHCYVVVEIKTGKFDSSYAGQLGTYVVACLLYTSRCV